MTTDKAIAVLGSGSWGTALAVCLARNGQDTLIWGHLPEQMQQLRDERCNAEFLPGIAFPENLTVSCDLQQAVAFSNDLLLVVPSEVFRLVLDQVAPLLRPGQRVAWASKGLENGSGKLLHQVAQESLGADVAIAVVSGPTFALEVAAGLPTAITVASTDEVFSTDLAARLHGGEMRAYTATDISGVEVGGAAKNVLAIAAGIADGLGFGANARAALVTRGLQEIMRLGLAMGGKRETFMGLTGMGDLVLTCTDNQSRNRRLGLAIGKGADIETALSGIHQVVEGYGAAKVIHTLAQQLKVDMPITEQVFQVLYNNRPPKQAVRSLFERQPTSEVSP